MVIPKIKANFADVKTRYLNACCLSGVVRGSIAPDFLCSNEKYKNNSALPAIHNIRKRCIPKRYPQIKKLQANNKRL